MQTEDRNFSVRSLRADEEFARAGDLLAAEVSVEVPSQEAVEPAPLPDSYPDKLEALHKALLGYQKAIAAIAPSDVHLRRGMTKAYEALLEVLKDDKD